MNASEIQHLEARLPVGLGAMPSPELMDRLIAQARAQRAQRMSADFLRMVQGFGRFAAEIRKIAVACTAARVHLQNV